MKTKNHHILFLAIFSIFCLTKNAFAENVAVGVSAGAALGFNSDFNNQNTKNQLHFDLGLDALYRLDCRRGGFCQALFLETNFKVLFASQYDFGSTQIPSSGNIGNFSEKLTFYSGALGLRKHFLPAQKFQPILSLGAGVAYIKISDVSFTNTFGTQQSLNLSTTSYNLDLNSGVGLALQLSPRLIVDVVARFHFLVPSGLNRSFLELPIGVKYTF